MTEHRTRPIVEGWHMVLRFLHIERPEDEARVDRSLRVADESEAKVDRIMRDLIRLGAVSAEAMGEVRRDRGAD
jgi:hypothetical protein